jgi:hypothetical protein
MRITRASLPVIAVAGTMATDEVLIALSTHELSDGRGAMHLDAETAATAVMAVAIAGIGPACVALLLLL